MVPGRRGFPFGLLLHTGVRKDLLLPAGPRELPHVLQRRCAQSHRQRRSLGCSGRWTAAGVWQSGAPVTALGITSQLIASGAESLELRHFDVIVLGGGTMGTAAAWALGKRGLRTLVLEQFRHVHDLGSHGGETRVIRHAYAESPEYVPLVRRADQLWQELEATTGEVVLVRCGGLPLAGLSGT